MLHTRLRVKQTDRQPRSQRAVEGSSPVGISNLRPGSQTAKTARSDRVFCGFDSHLGYQLRVVA